ncbi:YcaO-like family protein [Bacillus anthracis]|uniref:hypothetical protein n=1 Tax=Bacillus anthracis TaxID=1392 RepID=UPI003D190007
MIRTLFQNHMINEFDLPELKMIDSRFGIIKDIIEIPIRPSDPNIYTLLASSHSLEYISTNQVKNDCLITSGYGLNFHEALIHTCREFISNYCIQVNIDRTFQHEEFSHFTKSVATSTTIEHALMSGITDALAHNIFKTFCLEQTNVNIIDFFKIPSLETLYYERFEFYENNIHLLNISPFYSFPVILGVMIDNDGTVLTIPTFDLSIEKACKESLVKLGHLKIIKDRKFQSEILYPKLNQYLIQGYTRDYILDIILKSSKKDSLDNKLRNNNMNQLAYLIEFLEINNFKIIAIDITTEDIQQIGLKVMKILISNT